MAYENLGYEKRDKIAYITLNRPRKLNAFNPALAAELDDVLDDFDQDNSVWAAIMSGNGRCFSAGADVTVFTSLSREERAKNPVLVRSRNPGGFLSNQRNWKPIIAAVHGYCYGMALGLVLSCDLIVATEDAKFCIAEVQRGLSGGGLAVRMSYFGLGKVGTELALTGRDLTGAEAYRLGLVNRLVATQEELLPAAVDLVQQIFEIPPLAVRANVRICRQAADALLEPMHSLNPGQNLALTEDFEEAARAFLEKRKPVFKAR
ncbi:MAG: enoyl-CoA hydratase/isomerase family protein [Chloroflexi bacterium]|nr:enoyl-CoA hydratase/isomerase family protein [Chloroflexota bacterium]